MAKSSGVEMIPMCPFTVETNGGFGVSHFESRLEFLSPLPHGDAQKDDFDS